MCVCVDVSVLSCYQGAWWGREVRDERRDESEERNHSSLGPCSLEDTASVPTHVPTVQPACVSCCAHEVTHTQVALPVGSALSVCLRKTTRSPVFDPHVAAATGEWCEHACVRVYQRRDGVEAPSMGRGGGRSTIPFARDWTNLPPRPACPPV